MRPSESKESAKKRKAGLIGAKKGAAPQPKLVTRVYASIEYVDQTDPWTEADHERLSAYLDEHAPVMQSPEEIAAPRRDRK